MAVGVTCPQCGTVFDPQARKCPECGHTLAQSQANLKKAPPRKPIGVEVTAPDDTMMEEEAPAPKPPPRTSTGAVPKPKAPPAAAAPPPVPAQPERKADPLIGQKLQEYVIKERIGVGGMGIVYKAIQPMIGKEVAIKVLRSDVVTDPRDMERLLEEARVVNTIKHRGIINIFSAGTLPDGRHYLIMEFLEGESLEQRMAREVRVSAADATLILEEVLSALAAAHAAGIVHRDLKPANVFLVHEGNRVFAKLLDFGLARRHQQNVTRIAGTPDYISPEHARGKAAGPEADLYAFGVLCFHMLSGQLPFIGSTPMEVMEKHVHNAPPIPHEVEPSIPQNLSDLILRLLEKDPKQRPTADAVKADLRAATMQLRSASTMMSLLGVEALKRPTKKKAERDPDEEPASIDSGDDDEADEAQKKPVRRKTKAPVEQDDDGEAKGGSLVPFIVIGVLLLLMIAGTVYVKWPKKADAPTPPPVEQPKPKVVTPTAPAQPGEPKEPAPPPVDPKEAELNATLDDLVLGQLKAERHIDTQLEAMDIALKSDPKKKPFEKQFIDLQRTCNEATNRRGIAACSEALSKLRERFYAP